MGLLLGLLIGLWAWWLHKSKVKKDIEYISIEIEIMFSIISQHTYAAFIDLINRDMEAHKSSKDKMQAETRKLIKYLENLKRK